jgi:FSR family fosmidomycin resistance protein-like MFS transporter
MTFTLAGLILLASRRACDRVGGGGAGRDGSAVFHPTFTSGAMASGQHGLAHRCSRWAQAGSSMGPLLAAFVVLRRAAQHRVVFALALLASILLRGAWYKRHPSMTAEAGDAQRRAVAATEDCMGDGDLVALIFSKYFYLSSLMSYYTFYLISKFQVSVQAAQVYLFVFLGAVALGTIVGGPVGDRIGRKYVIWWSILGVLPFTLALPYADLFWTAVLSVIIGLVLASAFSAILVYAQDLLPGRVGMVSGLFFARLRHGRWALRFGRTGGRKGIEYVYHPCALPPAIGLLTAFPPTVDGGRKTPRAGLPANGPEGIPRVFRCTAWAGGRLGLCKYPSVPEMQRVSGIGRVNNGLFHRRGADYRHLLPAGVPGAQATA